MIKLINIATGKIKSFIPCLKYTSNDVHILQNKITITIRLINPNRSKPECIILYFN